MNTKMFILFFSVIVVSIEGSAPRVGRFSRALVSAIEHAQNRTCIAKINMRTQLAVHKEIMTFVKTDEFKQMLKTGIVATKEEIKEQCTCLKDHAKSPQIREVMIGTIVVHISKSIDQTLSTKPFITATDITIAVAQAVHQYAQDNTKNKK